MNITATALFASYALTLALALSGCARPTTPTAVPESIDLCPQILANTRHHVAVMLKHDATVVLAGLTPGATPGADEAYCRSVIEQRGAKILTKPAGQHHSTSLGFVVLLSPDYSEYTPSRKAATMCHEATHIVWQRRAGLPQAAAQYITPSGRLASEAVAYAVGEIIYTRHGATPAWLNKQRSARSNRFPTTYKLAPAVTPDCVLRVLTMATGG
jgi:hypothetical protein